MLSILQEINLDEIKTYNDLMIKIFQFYRRLTNYQGEKREVRYYNLSILQEINPTLCGTQKSFHCHFFQFYRRLTAVNLRFTGKGYKHFQFYRRLTRNEILAQIKSVLFLSILQEINLTWQNSAEYRKFHIFQFYRRLTHLRRSCFSQTL